MARKAERGSVVMNRLRSSIRTAASSDVALHADAADEERGFSSVVRLGARGPPAAVAVCPLASDALRPKACFLHCRLTGKARHRRCLRMPKRVSSSIRLSQSPLQLSWSWARLRITRVMLEVDLRCQALHSWRRTATPHALCHTVLLCADSSDLCRSPPQRAGAREICLHMRRDPKTSYPRMRGRIQRNRLPLTTINTMTRKRRPHPSQVLRGQDCGMEHLQLWRLRQSRNAQAGSLPLRWRAV